MMKRPHDALFKWAFEDPAAIRDAIAWDTMDRERGSFVAHQPNDDLAARSLAAPQKVALWLLCDARDPKRLLANFDTWIPVLREVGQDLSGPDRLACKRRRPRRSTATSSAS